MARAPKQDANRNFTAEKAKLLAALGTYHRRWNPDLVERAFDFALEVHKDQRRVSGEPYFSHPLAVANILVDLKTDHIAVAAGLLHDVVEDSPVTIADLTDKFGQSVALLVDGVTKISLSELRVRTWEEQQSESIRKMLLSMLKDLRVILIKFADRLHNMRTIDALSPKSQDRIATETRDVYAPLASRLGIARIAREMSDLALRVLDRQGYDRIEARIASTMSERQALLDEFVGPIRRELDRLGIKAELDGRVKAISSIYYKIRDQGREFEEIYDLIAIRIIVQQKAECYRALGVVHDLYTPVTEHFTDYIALPKSNLYQSLHTKVVNERKQILEVQIRTEEMHQLAENGIAAHWRYKEGQIETGEGDDHFAWVRSLMEMHQEGAENGDFMENLKVDLFHDEIYVFTPRGKLVQLPHGATPIDFAFAIHSDVGLHTIGAKVGGKMVAISHHLESGDVVEILTSPKRLPSPEWLKIAHTSRAKNRIKRWFRETRWDQARVLGEELINAELSRLKLKGENGSMSELAASFGYNDSGEFFVAVGGGELSLGQVMRKLVPQVAQDKESVLSRIIQRVGKDQKVRVGGFENLALSLGECCTPLPGDQIIGFQTAGRGVVIHRADCNTVHTLLDDERKVVSVAWDVETEDRFSARVYVVADDRPDLLRDVAVVLSQFKVNITSVTFHAEDNLAIGHLLIHVRNLPHLTRVLGQIHQIKGVMKVEREDRVVEEEPVV